MAYDMATISPLLLPFVRGIPWVFPAQMTSNTELWCFLIVSLDEFWTNCREEWPVKWGALTLILRYTDGLACLLTYHREQATGLDAWASKVKCPARFVSHFWRNFSGVKRTCWTTGSWRSCLSLEVVGSIPAGSTIIYRFLCGFICASLCQSIKIKPTNMYIASARAQFKINTHGCWNWHLCIPDGLSVVQCRPGHVIGVAFLTQFQWREAYVLDNWQLVELPQSGGREFDPRWVHDNLSVPLWVYMRFPVPEHQN